MPVQGKTLIYSLLNVLFLVTLPVPSFSVLNPPNLVILTCSFNFCKTPGFQKREKDLSLNHWVTMIGKTVVTIIHFGFSIPER